MAWDKETLIARREVREELIRLGIYPERRKSKSALNPSAKMVVTDRNNSRIDQVSLDVMASVERLKNRGKKLYYLAVFMLENGVRISEAISINSFDITATGLVHVKGKKRSKDRVCHSGLAREYFLDCRKKLLLPFADLDYFFVRREFIKAGLFYVMEGNKNAKVTHIFRHLAVSGTQSIGASLETSKEFIGHKSSSNTKRYDSIK